MPQPKPYPAAIVFEPEGYSVFEKVLMGRQAAGFSFLEALLKDNSEKAPVLGVTPHHKSATILHNMAQHLSAGTPTEWIKTRNMTRLRDAQALYLSDPQMTWPANIRLRYGIDAFSLCGITHTTASHAALDNIRGLVTAPVMPWDALICTSRSVRATVDTILRAEVDYLKWRLGTDIKIPACEFPVIPLGIDVARFSALKENRKAARDTFKVQDDAIVALFVGRLSPHVKANPLAMYQGLETVAYDTGKSITLIECGWTHNEAVDDMMAEARTVAPSVKFLQVDGRDLDRRDECLAAADIFISLSDNIQETFGLTPVEAMATGLPVIVSDWDGYSELMNDGVEGFKIPTSMPSLTETQSHRYEARAEIYERYCASVSQLTQVSLEDYITALKRLVADPTLRRTMGENGIARARAHYDWPVIFKAYRELWDALDQRRRSARDNPKYKNLFTAAPECNPARQSPSRLFPTYPTQQLDASTSVRVQSTDAQAEYDRLKGLKVVDISQHKMPADALVSRLLTHLEEIDTINLGDIEKLLSLDQERAQRLVAILLKLGILSLAVPSRPR